MNHDEQRIWLIQELQKEDSQLSNYPIPKDKQGQKNLLRGLMNIWVPKDYDDAFWKIHDEYLSEENRLGGIVDIESLTPIESDSRIYLWQGDMTTLKIGAIVNLRQTCNCMMEKQGHPEPTGQAKITPAYNLPCEYILHTVGPIVSGPVTKEHENLLASCYRSCLNLAEKNGIDSIAFCCISTGVFMFPNQRATEIAVETVRKWLDETGSQMKVVFNVFKDVDLEIYDSMLNK